MMDTLEIQDKVAAADGLLLQAAELLREAGYNSSANQVECIADQIGLIVLELDKQLEKE